MAFENLFIRTKKSLGGIQLDAVLTETHNNEIKLTKNPIELGADITDHAIIEPKRLSVLAQVSDTPLGAAAFGELVDTVTGFFGTSTSENLTRSKSAYAELVELMENREPIVVQTNLKLYENLVITNLSVSQDKDSARAVLLTINLEEVIITESQVIQLTPEKLKPGVTREQASTTEKRGRQEAQEPSEAVNRSVAKKIQKKFKEL